MALAPFGTRHVAATISMAVLDSSGKMVMESIIETKAATILQFVHGLRGNLHVTFEEGTSAAWQVTTFAGTARRIFLAGWDKMQHASGERVVPRDTLSPTAWVSLSFAVVMQDLRC